MFDFGIVPFELAKNWTERLLTEMQAIRGDRALELNRIANIFGDPQDLAEYYVQPDCQQFNPADSDNEEAYHLVREPMFDRIETFLSGDGARAGRHLLILSDAGMGKTSLLVMLKLAHLTSFWPKGYRCELLKLGPDTVASLDAIADKKDTVLLLDALDEDTLAWKNPTERTREILSVTENFKRTIITCRTQFLNSGRDPFNNKGRLEIVGYICPVIFNSLFTDRQVIKYLTNRFPKQVQDPDWQRRVSEIISSMGFLKLRPMLLAHIEDLIESDETAWNEYSIYRSLVTAWLMREQKKLFKTHGTSPSTEELLQACRFIALMIHGKDRLYLTADEMAIRAAAFSGTKGITVMQLGVRSLLTRDSDGNYKFSHYSILEYLLVDTLIAGKFQRYTENIRSTALMRVFAAAWIKSGNAQDPSLRRLTQIGLSGTDFSGAELSGINLSDFDCRDTNFSSANLSSADLSRANLDNSSFYQANISNARFKACSAISATFVYANASGASFENANLNQADFSYANIKGATLKTSSAKATKLDLVEVDDATVYPTGAKAIRFKEEAIKSMHPPSDPDDA